MKNIKSGDVVCGEEDRYSARAEGALDGDDGAVRQCASSSGSNNGTAKPRKTRYPSFRDMFLKPRRNSKALRQGSVSEEEQQEQPVNDSSSASSGHDDRSDRKKRKDKPSGCAGWLEKRTPKRKSKSRQRQRDQAPDPVHDSPPSSPSDRILKCVRCDQVESPCAPGVTYTKRTPPDLDEWLCALCARTLSHRDCDNISDDYSPYGLTLEEQKVPRLSSLVLDVLLMFHVSPAECSTR